MNAVALLTPIGFLSLSFVSPQDGYDREPCDSIDARQWIRYGIREASIPSKLRRRNLEAAETHQTRPPDQFRIGTKQIPNA